MNAEAKVRNQWYNSPTIEIEPYMDISAMSVCDCPTSGHLNSAHIG